MERFSFKLNDRFYQELHGRLEKRQTEEREAILAASQPGVLPRPFFPQAQLRRCAPETIPSAEVLRTLIETAFWTSLRREEGRELRFTIKYIRQASQNLSFKYPIDFTVSNLRKLAPALSNVEDVEAGVTLSADGRLKLAGISNLITEPLAIKVLDPGLVIVGLDLWNIAAISGDEPAFISNTLLSWSNDIWSIFAQNGDNSFSEPRVRTIINTARAMRLKGHGGTLLIVPPNADIEKSIGENLYEVNKANDVTAQPLKDLMEARRKLEANKEDKLAKAMERFSENRLLSNVPQFLAQVTLVDGATLMSSDFDVLAFGVKLKPSNDDIQPKVERIDPLEHEAVAETQGTRHTSAARFVFDNPGSVAIVVSQDGNVTAFVWRKPTGSDTASVHAFKRLELTLF
ncbi:MAG: putative sensor domain DACNV-containing protein [Pyrinomonadaceae bacterium]